MKPPATVDLSAYRGDDFEHKLVFVNDQTPPSPLDLRDYLFKAQVRDRPEYGTVIYAELEIDTDQADIGIIWLRLPAASVRFPPGYWDFEVTYPNNKKKTWLKGAFNLDGDVTQAAII